MTEKASDFAKVAGWIIVVFLGVMLICFLVALALARQSDARDRGQYADFSNELHTWFDQLASGKGLCCSFADGFAIKDVQWDAEAGHYRVFICGHTLPKQGEYTFRDCAKAEWITVPDNAVVKEPNKFGPAVVWPYSDANGDTQIRCFLPGAGT